MNPVLLSVRSVIAPQIIKNFILKRTSRSLFGGFNFASECLKESNITLAFHRHSYTQYRHFKRFRSLSSNLKLNDLVHDERVQKHLNNTLEIYKETEEKLKHCKEKELYFLKQTLHQLNDLVQLKTELDKCNDELQELEQIILECKAQKDEDFLKTAIQEKEVMMKELEQIKVNALLLLVPESTFDTKDTLIEISAGVGGQEAMLFSKDLFDLYCKYAAFKGWESEIIKYDFTELGGLRNAQISLSGQNVFRLLKFESGVHRVQRVPKTERAGRIHTSTATVVVLPQPNEIDIVLDKRDIEMVFKRSSGAGGQHVNTTDSCVRLKHIPTGIVVECQMERCQHRNRAMAMKALKTRLYEKEFNQVIKELEQNRKSIIGTSARSDKVRTYNFPQNRITDHRLQETFHDMEQYLNGENKFDALLHNLIEFEGLEAVINILQKYD